MVFGIYEGEVGQIEFGNMISLRDYDGTVVPSETSKRISRFSKSDVNMI